MLYLICFFISFAIFIIIGSNARVFDHNILLLVFVVTISNGGYYSISSADSLETAILGNKLAYVASVFAPMLIFLIICNGEFPAIVFKMGVHPGLCNKPLGQVSFEVFVGYKMVLYPFCFPGTHRTGRVRNPSAKPLF